MTVTIPYFEGLSWSNITREERFFCQHLYQCLMSKQISKFLNLVETKGTISQKHHILDIGFEVCFYRDYAKHFKMPLAGLSPKRTFDLALFSADAIFIIEAKAQQGHSPSQVMSFVRDKLQVQSLIKVPFVYLVSLTSSKYKIPEGLRDMFDVHLTWSEIAAIYENDDIFRRADKIYEFSNSGENKTGDKTGLEVVQAYQKGEWMWVGRKGNTKEFKNDIKNGSWKDKLYQINTESDVPPNENWFGLDDFIDALRESGFAI